MQSFRSVPMSDAATPPDENPPPDQSRQAHTVCRRCGTPGPVGDDGFCDKCEKALEQACL
jgi:hypothetical protein